MYSKIMTPVDLAHLSTLEKALVTSAGLANHYAIPACYVGITAGVPTAMAHTAAEYRQKLEAFAAAEAAKHGHQVLTKTIASHDPTADLDRTLLHVIDEIGADLVVMASHIPTLSDYVWPSHGGRLASHSKVSVFLIR